MDMDCSVDDPILVTGAAGFIGSNFVRKWLREVGTPVVSLDLLTYAGNLESLFEALGDPRHTFIKADIADYDLVSKVLERHKPRALVNFVAESHVDRSILGPEPFVQTNVVGTYRLLEAARAYWSGMPELKRAAFRFLHISTDEVFGALQTNDPAFTENTAYDPSSPYAATKAASDHLVRAWGTTYGLPYLITNCSNNYGPAQFPEKFIPLMILNAINGKSLPIYGDGQNVRDWIHVEDHCAAIMRVLADGKQFETYCIGGNSERTNQNVVQALCDILDRLHPAKDNGSYHRLITFVADRPGHDRRYAIDGSHIVHELGWRPATRFEVGLESTVRWYLDHGEWVGRILSGEYQNWVRKNYAQRATL
jgi:dTDP-glucose 4,6-dehydratase